MRNALLAAAILFVLPLAAGETTTGDPKMLDTTEFPVIKELPDPFLFRDGTRVKTPEDWARRREELKELFQKYVYGHLPPPPGNVAARELSSHKDEASGATVKQIVLTMGPQQSVLVHLDLVIPPGTGPFPAIVRGDLGWGPTKPELIEAVAKRGYVLAHFARVNVVPDDKSDRTGAYRAYPDCDMGAVAAWAWGFHRVADYLLTLDCVAKDQLIATGHSRGGKATLLAGAMDERFAVTAPNNSGCGGAGCFRRQAPKSEDIVAITKNFPYWFQKDFTRFIGHVDQLPVDQHELKALVAPRALLSTEALGDLWANPMGTQQTHTAARDVFTFLGVQEKIGIHFREGGHAQGVDDFQVLMDFCDRQLLGKTVERKFDRLAFPDAEKAYTWTAPNR
jgi:dienelactone hydrolase